MFSIAVLLADGFEEIEAFTPVDVLRRANFSVSTFAVSDSTRVTGSHNITTIADAVFNNSLDSFDALILPGGQPGTSNLANNHDVINSVISFANQSKLIAAICAAPSILLKAHVIDNDAPISAHPSVAHLFSNLADSPVVSFNNFITAQSAAFALHFSFAILEHFNFNPANIKSAMLFRS